MRIVFEIERPGKREKMRNKGGGEGERGRDEGGGSWGVVI